MEGTLTSKRAYRETVIYFIDQSVVNVRAWVVNYACNWLKKYIYECYHMWC